jgi:hypothetical protein
MRDGVEDAFGLKERNVRQTTLTMFVLKVPSLGTVSVTSMI